MIANLAKGRVLSAAVTAASVLALSGISAPAAASPYTYDFRSTSLYGGIATPNPNPSTFSPAAASVPVGLTIAGYGSNTHTSPRPLWWDATDGVGVDSTNTYQASYEADEVEGNERLVFTFDKPVMLTDILITDLFPNESRTSAAGNSYLYNETGYFQLDNGTVYTITAQPGPAGTHALITPSDGTTATGGIAPTVVSASVNGEWTIVLPQPTLVTSLTFSAPGIIHTTTNTCITYTSKHSTKCKTYDSYDQDNDLSVAGLTIVPPGPHTNSVPEPGPMAMLGLGIVGLGILRRRGRA